jgi:hypothetical protein
LQSLLLVFTRGLMLAMPMPDELRQELLVSTREAAAALIEDMAHMREVLQKIPQSSAETRRLSAILRRVLIERSLTIVASPRMGRITIHGPDNSIYYKFIDEFTPKPAPHIGPNRWQYIGCFISGARLDGWTPQLRAILQTFNTTDTKITLSASPKPSDIEPFRLDTFLTQRVLYLQGHWASRADVIKFMANVASGVHAGSAIEPEHLLVDRMRAMMSVYLENGVWIPTVGLNVLKTPMRPFKYKPRSINAVMIEILAAAYYVVNSHDVQNLEEIIKQELSSS